MEALRAIQQQSLQNYEVIIVETVPSQYDTSEQVQKFAKADRRFIYVSTFEKGDFVARTIGCQRAKADLILTIDDDWIVTDPNTLDYIVRCFDEDVKLGVLGVRAYYAADNDQDKVVPYATHRNWKEMFRNTKLYYSGKINRWGMIGTKFHYLPMGQKHKLDHVRSCCMSFRKEVARKYRYFPTFYVINRDGYRSETELCRRIAKAGYDVVFSSEIQGLHKTKPRQPDTIPRSQTPEFLYATGRNNMLFFLRNYWSRLNSIIFFLWDVFVGNSTQPGLIRFFVFRHLRNNRKLIASLKGKFRGFAEYNAKYHDLQKTS